MQIETAGFYIFKQTFNGVPLVIILNDVSFTKQVTNEEYGGFVFFLSCQQTKLFTLNRFSVNSTSWISRQLCWSSGVICFPLNRSSSLYKRVLQAVRST